MEALERHLPHDLEPRDLGYIALRNLIDVMFETSDDEVREILNKYTEED